MPDIIHLLNQYGYIILFLSLLLELIIVPIPNEALMSYVGVLCFQGKMNIILCILSAGLGGIIGVTISYWIGYKLGAPFFNKYGRYIHMGPEKMERMSGWYAKYGKVLLLVSFFIPGVRHIASIISGVIKLPFRSFSFFAYIGVFFWVGTFIWLGDVMGPNWDQFQGEIKKWLVLASIIIGFVALLYIVIKANKDFIKESLFLILQAVFHRFKSFLKIKLLILTFLILFLFFFTLMVGLIQDLISNEFGQFNAIFRTIVFSLFNKNWKWIMDYFYLFGSWTALGTISLITVVVIFMNKKNIWLELIFFMSSMIGTLLLSKSIHWIFHFILGSNHISPSFPDEKSMLVLSVYGFFVIMLIRHSTQYVLSIATFFLFLVVLFAFSMSGVYLHHINPSDMMAGYVFSSVWVSGTILSLEMFRFLSLIKEDSGPFTDLGDKE